MTKIKLVWLFCLGVFMLFAGTLHGQQSISIAQARATKVGDTVSITGLVLRSEGRLTYVQQDTAAIAIFQTSGTFRTAVNTGAVALGDIITVRGTRADFNGLQEINALTFSVVSRGNKLPAPIVVTLAALKANGEKYESELIQINNLTTTRTGKFAAATSYIVDDSTSTFTLRTPSASDTRIEGTPIPTGAFSFVGVMGQFNTDYQLAPVSSSDVFKPGAVDIKIFHNNDGESQLIDAGANLRDFGGVARFKTRLDSLRKAAPISVTLSSGDNYLAGPEFNASLNRATGPYYDAVALDSIKYDAICLGNHDFDFGPAVLAKMITGVSVSKAVFLSANLNFSNEADLNKLVNEGRIAPSTIVSKDGYQIGVIGVTTPDLASISSPGNVQINRDVLSVVQNQVNRMLELGVNKIILISHLQGIGEDTILSKQLIGVDVIIAGGGGEILANPGQLLLPGDVAKRPYPIVSKGADGKPTYIVTTTGDYKYIGQLIVSFDENGDIVLVDPKSGPVRVSGIAPDATLPDAGLQASVVTPVSAYIAGQAGNIIASTDVALDGVTNNVRAKETNLGNLIADAFLWQANQLAPGFGVKQADVALANGGGIRNNSVYNAGSNITELNTFDILPFSNFLTIVPDITPAQFKEIMENAVSRVDTNSGTGRFAQIAGFKIVYDSVGRRQLVNGTTGNITRPGNRIISIILDNGTPIVLNKEVVAGAPNVSIAIADFLVKGGDEYPFRGAAFTALGVTYQRSLYNYIVEALKGKIEADQYPAGGAGRILRGPVPTFDGFKLTILHNNDGESQIINAGTGREEFGGVARFKSLVDRLRGVASQNSSGAITLSSGDNYLAGPEFSASLNRDSTQKYYDAIVFDSVGYDALCLGNHDFDFGPKVLSKMIADASVNKAPFLSANLDFQEEPSLNALVAEGRILPATIVEISGQKVGVIGLTTPDLQVISSPGRVKINRNLAEIVQAQVILMQAQGVNKIVLISHLQGLSEDTTLVKNLKGIDVIIAGGGSELLANEDDLLIPGDKATAPYPLVLKDADNRNVYVVTTSGDYKYVGRLVITFDEEGEIALVDPISGPVRVSGTGADAVLPDSGLQNNVVAPIQEYLAAQRINILAKTEVELDGKRTSVRAIETNEGNLVADAFLWAANKVAADFEVGLAQVAITNGGGIRNDNTYAAGSDISELNTFEILPFANFLTIVSELTPERFKIMMENAVSRIDTSGDGRFGQIAGFKVVYNPNGRRQIIDLGGNVTKAGNRILSITLNDGTKIVENGTVVAGAPNVNVATVDFLAKGGDQYPLSDLPFTILGQTYQRALATYLAEELKGVISAAKYPAGGEGRIVTGVPTANDRNLSEAYRFVAYPNPSKDEVRLSFTLPKSANVSVKVYDLVGAEIATLSEGISTAGSHELVWNAANRSAGVYFVKLKVDNTIATQRIQIVR